MKQILVISGKGGTGKTVITGSFAALAESKVMVDCDVDAADLHLLLHPATRKRYEFKSGQTAVIDRVFCKKCGKCAEICRFGAIKADCSVESFSCEGCGLCSRICPNGAIRMKENLSGEWFVADTKYGPFVHAKLGIAEENSGKLVAKIRQAAKELAQEKKLEYVIVDGPPGIGCPVIASLAGIDCALIVTEPSLSGLHDADRVIRLARHFKVPVKLVINKFDLNLSVTEEIKKFCSDKDVPLIGKIRFDKSIITSIVQGVTIPERADSSIQNEIAGIWSQIK